MAGASESALSPAGAADVLSSYGRLFRDDLEDGVTIGGLLGDGLLEDGVRGITDDGVPRSDPPPDPEVEPPSDEPLPLPYNEPSVTADPP